MAASHTLPHSPALRQLPKHGILILHGFGIKVRLDQNHFLAEWGVGLDRHCVRLSRVDGRKLRRVIMLGNDGYISLEALRFITDVGASFSLIDKRGKALMVCSPVAPSDSKLRRAQSLAIMNGTALRLSKEIISEKLSAQAALVRGALYNDAAADIILRFRDELPAAQSIESVRIIEGQAGRCYWQCWSDVPVMWTKKDSRRIPEHWKHFGQRISQLTHSPRLSTNPPNSLLNMLYCLLENETRIAIVAMGLLPDVGMFHTDTPNRDSLVFDIMEVCRPKVDAFVLHWLQTEPFRKSDWWEDRDGSCRMVTSLAVKLCETSDTWRRLISPHVEWLAQELWNSTVKSMSKLERQLLSTRLTQRHRKSVKGSEVPAVAIPKPDHVCVDCGAIPDDKRRNHCGKCGRRITIRNFRAGRTAAQRPDSIAKRSRTMQAHKAAIDSWNPSHLPAALDRDAYLNRVVPALAHVPMSRIRSTLEVSEPYARWIKIGKRLPHARHWQKLATLAGVERL
jgi:CRISPR-associated endonuclease Cas1